MQKSLLIGYSICLHSLLILMLVKTDFIPRVGYRIGLIRNVGPEITKHYEQTKNFLERMDANTPDGTAIFIGDSSIQGLSVAAIVNPSVNFGIGTDTTVGVLERLPKYRSLKQASVCILSIGGNDLRRRGNEEILKNYAAILHAIPPRLPIVVNAVLPVDEHVRDDLTGRNRRSRALNSALKTVCVAQSPRCTFVDPGAKLVDASGHLSKQYHVGDGVHLNGVGNAIWIQALKDVVSKPRQKVPVDTAEPRH